MRELGTRWSGNRLIFAIYLIKWLLICVFSNIYILLIENWKLNQQNNTQMDSVKIEKVMVEVIGKLEKIKETELASELSWCWVSFQNDGNPVGVIEKATLALAAFKEAREKNSKAVAKKLVDDLEKALA